MIDANLNDLLSRTGHGDEAALSELQQRTRAGLFSLIRGIVVDAGHAEEVLQDVYTYIWFHGADFRGDRGAPLSWMRMLARSRAIDSYRRARRESVVVEFDDQVRTPCPVESRNDSIEIWWHSQVRSGLHLLPTDQRQLIDMAFFDGFSHSEIAGRTGLPLGTVKTRIRTALGRLREQLENRPCLARAA